MDEPRERISAPIGHRPDTFRATGALAIIFNALVYALFAAIGDMSSGEERPMGFLATGFIAIGLAALGLAWQWLEKRAEKRNCS